MKGCEMSTTANIPVVTEFGGGRKGKRESMGNGTGRPSSTIPSNKTTPAKTKTQSTVVASDRPTTTTKTTTATQVTTPPTKRKTQSTPTTSKKTSTISPLTHPDTKKPSPPTPKKSRLSKVGSPPVNKMTPEQFTKAQQETIRDRWITISTHFSVDSDATQRVVEEISSNLVSAPEICSFLLQIHAAYNNSDSDFREVLKLFACLKIEKTLRYTAMTRSFVNSLAVSSLVSLINDLRGCESHPIEAAVLLAEYKIASLDRNVLELLHKFLYLRRTNEEYLISFIQDRVILLPSTSAFIVALFEEERKRLRSLIDEVSGDNIVKGQLRKKLKSMGVSNENVEMMLDTTSDGDLMTNLQSEEDVTKETIDALIKPFEKVPARSELKKYLLDTPLAVPIPVSSDSSEIWSCPGLSEVYSGLKCRRESIRDSSEASLARCIDKYFAEIFHQWRKYNPDVAARSKAPQRNRTETTASVPGTRADWWFEFDGKLMVKAEEKCEDHPLQKPTKELRKKICNDPWFETTFIKYLVTYATSGATFQPCVCFQGKNKKYVTELLGPSLDMLKKKDKLQMFIFAVNVCRLIKTFDVFHRIPLTKDITLKNEQSKCVVTLKSNRHIHKKISVTCSTLSVETFHSVYRRLQEDVDKTLRPFVIHAVDFPIVTNSGRKTRKDPKKKKTKRAKELEVTLAPLGDARHPTNELELFVAAVSTLFGLAGLHSLGIAHRDVRWPNLVFNPETNAWLLIDLEYAAEFGTSHSKTVHLLEKPVDRKCSSKSDIYMLGKMLGRSPFCQTHPERCPEVNKWAELLSRERFEERPSTEEALKYILENPPPSANKGSVLNCCPALATLLKYDSGANKFRLKKPLPPIPVLPSPRVGEEDDTDNDITDDDIPATQRHSSKRATTKSNTSSSSSSPLLSSSSSPSHSSSSSLSSTPQGKPKRKRRPTERPIYIPKKKGTQAGGKNSKSTKHKKDRKKRALSSSSSSSSPAAHKSRRKRKMRSSSSSSS
ncbi:hypothetical protein Pelo_6604 [Pelomyxa schiedti]|nr:hypothetical protein Pelo_6604 [Pelomyxa schiedti]